MKYLFFDTETCGLPKRYNAPVEDVENWPSLVQIAWVLTDSKGEIIMDECDIIKPNGFTIPPEASKIHGITHEKALAEGEKLKDVLARFNVSVTDADVIIAHNISFDECIVGAEFIRTGIKTPFRQKIRLCTMKSSTNVCKIPGKNGGYKWPKLEELHEYLFQENFIGAHDALNDVLATQKCFFELKERGVFPRLDEKGLEMRYFVLKPGGKSPYAEASRAAVTAYANAIDSTNKKLAAELIHWANAEYIKAEEA